MFKVNLSFIISSIIRTIIFIVIFGAVLYFLKSFSPDFYNKEIYSRVTGKKIVLLDNSMNNVEVNIEEDLNDFEESSEVEETKIKKVAVESVFTSTKRKVVELIDGDSNKPQETSDSIEEAEPAPAVQQTVEVVEEEVFEEPEIPEDYDGPNWAVVAVNTDIYNKEKNKIGSILGGIVVETRDHIFMKNTALIQCYQINDGIINPDVEFFIKESDLVMFRGPYNNKVHPDKTTIIDFCTARGKYQSLLTELRKEEIKKNPHYTEYHDAVKVYKNLKKESDELEEKRKTTSGAAKANLEDKIHKLKLEEVTARKTLNDAQRKYDSWRTKNLGSGEDIKITPTPELNQFKAEMDALYPRANEICPGI